MWIPPPSASASAPPRYQTRLLPGLLLLLRQQLRQDVVPAAAVPAEGLRRRRRLLLQHGAIGGRECGDGRLRAVGVLRGEDVRELVGRAVRRGGGVGGGVDDLARGAAGGRLVAVGGEEVGLRVGDGGGRG